MINDTFTIQEWLTNQDLIMYSALFLCVLLVLLNRRSARISWLEWRTRRCLSQIGIKQRKDVICPDGLGGKFTLDRLIMLPDTIVLINFKRYPGKIYCGESMSEWIQVVGQKNFKFENPLFDLESQVTAIRQQLPNVNIKGYLFFDHTANFPKGHPTAVLHPDNVPTEFLRVNCAEAKADILSAWESLTDIPVSNRPNQPQHLKT